MSSRIKHRLGQLKTWQERVNGYLAVANFFMILWLYIKSAPFGLAWYWWVGGLAVGSVVLVIIDMTLIWPSQQTYSMIKNPFLVEMMGRIKHIEGEMEEMKHAKA